MQSTIINKINCVVENYKNQLELVTFCTLDDKGRATSFEHFIFYPSNTTVDSLKQQGPKGTTPVILPNAVWGQFIVQHLMDKKNEFDPILTEPSIQSIANQLLDEVNAILTQKDPNIDTLSIIKMHLPDYQSNIACYIISEHDKFIPKYLLLANPSETLTGIEKELSLPNDLSISHIDNNDRYIHYIHHAVFNHQQPLPIITTNLAKDIVGQFLNEVQNQYFSHFDN